MYEELVKRIRGCSYSDPNGCEECRDCPNAENYYECKQKLALQAADAIEELSKRITRAVELYNRGVEKSAMWEALEGISPEPPKKGGSMRVLVACEESQVVCKAFRALGHEAFSCDIQECSGGHPEWHIWGDVLTILEPQKIRLWDAVSGSDVFCQAVLFETMDGVLHQVPKWDLIIAHPPCTDLAVSGARHFARKRADGSQQKSIDFFLKFTNLSCEKVAIENPVCIMSSIYRKPDQIIQPWQFGHPVSKKTCLWLKGLPPLKPTDIVEPGKTDKYGFTDGAAMQMARDENGKIISWNDPRTAKARSKTFYGIGRAMAEQWGSIEPPKEEA